MRCGRLILGIVLVLHMLSLLNTTARQKDRKVDFTTSPASSTPLKSLAYTAARDLRPLMRENMRKTFAIAMQLNMLRWTPVKPAVRAAAIQPTMTLTPLS